MENFLIISSIFDNCGLDSVAQNPLIGSILDSNFTITLSAYDSTGNSNSCQINVNLIDTVSPVVICPDNQSVNLSTDCEYRVEDFESDLAVYDNCGIISSVTQFPSYDWFWFYRYRYNSICSVGWLWKFKYLSILNWNPK